ncbi:apoptosis regulatory protein Siva isoform X2 [Numida meleagris]|uniref:apoptosis regulatory protein Siva isoform X2 n=1 Tax=Numida meleagris TaxID=8996 RepID=UPI000B3DAC0A|nr:apoptosis regulatory protein Siva isoform X2 [Numida meleagris]
MPKRSCPFGEAAPLQLKTRVGLRELSRGVRGEEYRREIFERTRRLLFRGAQACMENPWPAAPRAASRSPEPEPAGGNTGRRRSAQLLIGPDGKLLRLAAAAERERNHRHHCLRCPETSAVSVSASLPVTNRKNRNDRFLKTT